MRARARSIVVVSCLAWCAIGACAQPVDKTAERAARRAQLQVQAMQQQLHEAQAAKDKVEADKAAADKALSEQTQQAGRARSQLQKVSAELRAAEAARKQLAAAVTALEKQLSEHKRLSDEALAAKGRELSQLTKLRDDQQSQLQRKHDDQVAQIAECTGKNTRLIALSAELLDRWRNKSFADVLKERDVVLGLRDVEMFNLVQDYRDKAEAERFTSPINR